MKAIQTLLVVCTALATLACSSMGGAPLGQDGSTPNEATAKQLGGDVPLPPGAAIRAQDSLVMGTGNNWTGRLSLSVPGEPQSVFAWFRDSLPAAGWSLSSSSFSRLSLLTFSKAERIATVQMQGTNFGGNEVLITVTPSVRPAASRP